MKNDKCPTQEGEIKLSGVVSTPSTPLNSDAQENWIINSFRETRFQNVLKRATISPKTSWFWHHNRVLHLSEAAIAVIACNLNDYGQILTKRYQLTQEIQKLDPVANLLLLITPDTTHTFGIVLSTQSDFSTNILFVEKKEDRWKRWSSEEVAIHNSPTSTSTISTRHQAEDLALCSNNSDRRY